MKYQKYLMKSLLSQNVTGYAKAFFKERKLLILLKAESIKLV